MLATSPQALQDMKAWIISGGVSNQVAVATLPAAPQPMAPSDGKSELMVSNAELLSPHQVIPKVHQADNVEHTLNNGL